MRTTGSVNKSTLQFLAAYDALVEKLGIDPVAVLFRLCRSKDLSIRVRAATALIGKRFPQQLAIRPVESQSELDFTWSDSDSDSDSIHATATPTDSPPLN